MEKNSRIEKWDILKFFLIFLVVFGHCIDSIYEYTDVMKSLFLFIYTFHMPVFIFISGLFSKKAVNEKRYDKITGYFFLFYFTKIICFIGRVIGYGRLEFSVFFEGGLPWYMLAMFVFPLITIAIKKYSPVYVFIFFIILACLAGYDNQLGDKFSIARLIVFYPFYFAGYCLKPKKVAEFLGTKSIKIISVAVISIFALTVFLKPNSCYWLRPLLSGRNPYSRLGSSSGYGILYRLAYYVIAFSVGAAVISLTPNRLGKGKAAELGRRTLQVYSLQYLFIHIYCGRIGPKLLPSHPLIVILCLSCLITYVCSLKIWEPIFDVIAHPKLRKSKNE